VCSGCQSGCFLLLLALGLALTTLRRGELTVLLVIIVILITLTTELQEEKEGEAVRKSAASSYHTSGKG
jgi:hypothetical protein